MKPAPVLLPFSWLYGAAVQVRNRLYDTGMLKTSRAGVPVVSVGNLTAGGTGKTPLAGEIIGRLHRRGLTVGLISRGYRRDTRGVRIVADRAGLKADASAGGDEPVMLARRHPGTVIVVAARRREAASIAVRQLGAEVLVMDDGFQHRALARDLNILIIDGRRDLRHVPLLPAGLRREPLSSLRRADLLVVSKVSSTAAAAAAAACVARWYQGPVAGFSLEAVELRDVMTGLADGCPAGTPALVFSGIAGNADVAASAASLGLSVAGTVRFEDHHPFEAADVRLLSAEARRTGARVLITTEKDAARLQASPALAEALGSDRPLRFLHMEVRFCLGEELLDDLLQKLGGGKTP
ncbi:MAG TPA: tetraacyldisaccharide 4'-kinase [Bacteroidota bacterium]